jgi:hypothetical protein
MHRTYRSSLVLFFCGFTLIVSLLHPYTSMAQTTTAADFTRVNEQQNGQSPSPAQLELLGYMPGPVYQVVANDTIAVAVTAGDLVVLDIRNPAAPRVLSRLPLRILPTGSTYGQKTIELVGNYLFIACPHHCGDAGLFVINIAVPTAPVVVGKLKGVLNLNAINVVGNLLYGAVNSEFAIIDIQEPTAPKLLAVQPLVGQFAMASNLAVTETAAGERYAFVTSLNGKLYIFDVTTPTAPKQVATYTPENACITDVAIWDQGNQPRLYLIDCYAGVRVLDVSFPVQPREITTYSFGVGNKAYAITAVGQQLFVATDVEATSAWDSTLHLLDASGDTVQEVASFTEITYLFDIAAVGSMLLWSDLRQGVQLLDFQEPTAIRELGRQPVIDAYHGVATDGRYLYVVDETGLKVIDPTNPIAPRYVAAMPTPYGKTLAVEAGFALMSTLGGGLWLFDVQQPTHPKVVSHSSTPVTSATDMVISGTLGAEATVFLSSLGCNPFTCEPNLISVDLASGQQPSVTVLLPPDNSGIGEMVQAGNFLYATTGSPAFLAPSDLLIFDSTNLKALKAVGKLALPAPVASMATAGQALYIALTNALHTYDITDPSAPRLTKTIPLSRGFSTLLVANGLLYGNDDFALVVLSLAEPLQPSISERYALLPGGVNIVASNRLASNQHYLYLLNGGLTIWRQQSELQGRVLDAWGEPQSSAQIYAAAESAALDKQAAPLTFSGLTGSYGLPDTMTGRYTIQAAVDGYTLWPPTHTGVARTGGEPLNFYVLTQPVSMTVQPDTPTTFSYRDGRGLQTRATIGAGTVERASVMQLTPIMAFDQGDVSFTGNAFALTVTDVGSGEQARTLSHAITVTIQYSTQGVNAILSARSLQLWQEINGEWRPIPEQVASSRGKDNRVHNTFTIALRETGRYALFGRTNTFYLPLATQVP